MTVITSYRQNRIMRLKDGAITKQKTLKWEGKKSYEPKIRQVSFLSLEKNDMIYMIKVRCSSLSYSSDTYRSSEQFYFTAIQLDNLKFCFDNWET